MMTQQLEVSILAAPLAAIDPRSLSQAWYSALRLSAPAQPNVDVRTHSVRPVAARRGEPHYGSHVPPGSKPSPTAPYLARSASVTIRCDGATMPLRRPAPAIPLAVRIERAFAGERDRPKRATFSLGRGNARVHVILQTNGEHTTLLALCRPEVRGTVSRALMQARGALAARGIFLRLRAFGGRACS